MINLGEECRDKVTGFRGIAIARTLWLNGCARVTIQPKMDKDGKHPDAVTFDEPQLEVTGKGIRTQKTDTGGPLPIRISQKRGPQR